MASFHVVVVPLSSLPPWISGGESESVLAQVQSLSLSLGRLPQYIPFALHTTVLLGKVEEEEEALSAPLFEISSSTTPPTLSLTFLQS